MLLRLIFDRDIHMDVFPQLIIADVACIHPFPALPDTGFKIQGFSVFLFHIPFQVPENTRAASDGKVHRIIEYDAETAVARRFHNRLPETGADGHAHITDDLSPLVADHVEIFQLGFRQGYGPRLIILTRTLLVLHICRILCRLP